MQQFSHFFRLVKEVKVMLGHLLLIKKFDYTLHILTICAVASLTFILCLRALNVIQKTKCDNILRSLQKSGSKLSAEERFLAASSMAQAYSSMVVTLYFGFFFYLFAQGFMSRHGPLVYI
jgi:ABC-type phosphate transport system permease subunit